MTVVLGIHGSPRAEGNSALLLRSALEGASEAGAEIRLVSVCEEGISPCTACDHCWGTGECDVLDGMRRVYALIEEADAIIVAAPIYFSGLPAQLKAAIDRCQCLWVRKEVLGQAPRARKGAFIAVGGAETPIFRNAVSVVRSFFTVLGTSYDEELLVGGVDAEGDIGGRPELEAAKAMGRRLAASTE